MKKIKHRFDILKKYINEKEVLDLGCVDHNAMMEKNIVWQHKFLRKYANSIIGVDLEKEEVAKLKKKGYNIILGDVEDIKLNKRFDVIIAGKLIEHLNNQGLFLENVKLHLKEDGFFILTTPNCFAFRNILRSFIFGTIPTNSQHTVWHSSITLRQLVQQFGFEVVESAYYFDPYSNQFKYIIERIFSVIHDSWSPNMLFILRKAKK